MPKQYRLKLSADTFPLALSDNSRHLISARGVPHRLNIAAASWDLIQAVSYATFTSFVDQQVARGFNALDISAISYDALRFPSSTGNHFAAPDWHNGTSSVPPFLTPGNFSTLNPAYVTHLQACVDYCASVGVTVFLVLSYLGYQGDTGAENEGWARVMVNDTDAHCRTYGEALAAALVGRTNVIMVAGGDFRPAPSSTLESRLLAMIAGFLSVDNTKFWCGHWEGDTNGDGALSALGGDLASDQAAFASLVAGRLLLSHYAYNDSGKRGRRRIRDAYQTGGVALKLDSSYEGDSATSTALILRARTHSTMCEGSCAMTYARGGSSPDGWVYLVALNAIQGTNEHGYAWAFWNAIPPNTWAAMAPDSGTFVTSGRGTDSNTADDYVSVIGSTACLVAYIPSGSGRTITVALSAFTGAGSFSGSGTRRIRKFDPTNGTYTTLAASVATSGTTTIGVSGTYTLGTNSNGETDWLVVID